MEIIEGLETQGVRVYPYGGHFAFPLVTVVPPFGEKWRDIRRFIGRAA